MAGRAVLTLILIGIILFGCGYYIVYRQTAAQTMTHITAISQIQSLPATECTYSPGSYGTGSGGAMYVYNGQLFITVVDLEINGYSGAMEAVLSENAIQVSPRVTGATSGPQLVLTALNTVITQAPWQCSPWWFPTSSSFIIPNAVSM